jgi:hypothetical protein
VQQDFAYFGSVVATNHILMWLVREQAVPVHHVPSSCSVAFFVQWGFDRSELPTLNPDTVTIEVAEQAWACSMAIVRAESPRDVWLCKMLFFIEQGWLGAAWVEAQRFVNTTGRVTGPALEDVHNVVAPKDGEDAVWSTNSTAALNQHGKYLLMSASEDRVATLGISLPG